MKGYIDKCGRLHILRPGMDNSASTWSECRQQESTSRPCDHRCSLFKEPRFNSESCKWILELCKTTWLFDEFEDQRKKDYDVG